MISQDIECPSIDQAKQLDAQIAGFKRRFLVYTAGPYRSSFGEYWVQQNIREAEKVAVELWRMGFAAICPHKNSSNMGGACGLEADADVWLEGDLEMVARCDLVVMLPAWEMSKGAMIERRFALQLAMPVFYWPECRTRLGVLVANSQSISGVRQYIADRGSRIDRATGRATLDSRNLHARPATEAAPIYAAASG